MTSLCRKKDPRQKFSPTKCSLLRSISEDSPTTYLKIPRIYLKKCREKYEKELSKVIHLKLPCGTEWKVEVTEHKGHFWFEKGWEDFFKFYSLQSNGSIDFQYEGNSRFKVKIYDKSKIEIDYPIKSTDMQENGVNDHSPLASPPQPQQKKEATSSGGKEDLSANKDEGGKSSTTQRSPKPTAEVPMRMDSSATGEKATALQKANEFKSRNPSCFLVTMHSSYIKGHRLWLSAEISKNMFTNLSQNSGNVSLRVLEGSTREPWTVEMKYDTERTTFKFQSGWNKFVQDNKLNAGDVCGFMLIDEIGLLFEVNIFRRTEVATSSPGIDEDDVDNKDDHGLHEANDDYAADENGHRSFRNVLQKTAISHYLWLCSKFSEKHLSKKPSNAELHVPGGRTTWHVGLKYDVGRKGAKFQSGWTKFVRDNNLKKGDECVFVLTDENKFSFEVVIIAAKSTLPPDIDDANDNIKDDEDDTSDDEGDDYDDDNDHSDEDEDNEYSSAQQFHKRKRSRSSTKSSIKDVGAWTSSGQFLKRRPGVPRSKHPIRATKNDIALQEAEVFKYVEPHFVVPMTPTNVRKSFLKLPCVFVEKNLDKRPSHVSLWGSNDIYWPVELHFSKEASFQGGWIEFVRHHNLKEGDACGFELTEKRKFLFDVHIFRTT